MKNEKIILWKMNRNKENAYQDQYGVPHKAIVVEEEIVATIIEDKTLPIGGSSYSKTFATEARSDDGRLFCLYTDWSDLWYEIDPKSRKVKERFKDALNEFNRMKWEKERLSKDSYMMPVIRENGDLAIPLNIEECTCSLSESHHDLKSHFYYKPNGHCDCFFLKEL